MVTDAAIRLAGGDVVLETATRRCDVVVADGRIAGVGDVAASADEIVVDADGFRVAPGYIDLQINGGHGLDLATDPSTMWRLADHLPDHGVTSFLPTIITSRPGTIDDARVALADRPPDHVGARPLGLHLEGPMLDRARAGAHPATALRPPSLDLVDGWSPDRGVAMVTLAPELPGALDVVRVLRERGVVVAIGHSDATHDEVVRAIEAGATHVTHLFNAMSAMHHREPGVVGTALARDDLTAGIVVDGVHVHRTVVALAWAAKGPRGLALVSDAVAAQGMAPGRYEFGATTVVLDQAGVRTADGTIAGSSLTLDAAVRNLVDATGCRWDEAVRAASSVPARIIGAGAKGEIAPGRDADLVLLDEELAVAVTIVGGRVVHDPAGLAASAGRPTS